MTKIIDFPTNNIYLRGIDEHDNVKGGDRSTNSFSRWIVCLIGSYIDVTGIEYRIVILKR